MTAPWRDQAYDVVVEEYRGCARRSAGRDTRLLGTIAVLAGYLQAIRDVRSHEALAETLIGVSEALDEVLAEEVRRP
jgi:hypothetical protein